MRQGANAAAPLMFQGGTFEGGAAADRAAAAATTTAGNTAAAGVFSIYILFFFPAAFPEDVDVGGLARDTRVR